MKKNSLFAIFLLGISILAFAEKSTPDNLIGLKTGMSKSEVLGILQKNSGITHIQPVPKILVTVNSSSELNEKIDLLFSGGGVALEGSKINMKININNDVVSDIYNPDINKKDRFGIKSGMSVKDAKNIVIKLFGDEKIKTAYNFLSDNIWRKIEDMSPSDLDAYDDWGFHGASTYSFTKIHFKENKLFLIENESSPVELP